MIKLIDIRYYCRYHWNKLWRIRKCAIHGTRLTPIVFSITTLWYCRVCEAQEKYYEEQRYY